MNDLLTSPVLAALAASAGTWLLTRLTKREDLVGELRKALDRGLVRETALCSGLDRAIDWIDQLIEQMVEPPASVVHFRERLLDLLIDARARMQGKSK